MNPSLRLRSIVLIAAVLVSAFAPVLMWPARAQAAPLADEYWTQDWVVGLSKPNHYGWQSAFSYDSVANNVRAVIINGAVSGSASTVSLVVKVAGSQDYWFYDANGSVSRCVQWTQDSTACSSQGYSSSGTFVNSTSGTTQAYLYGHPDNNYGSFSGTIRFVFYGTPPTATPTATPTPTLSPTPTLTGTTTPTFTPTNTPVPTNTSAPTLTPTAAPVPATEVWKEGNYIRDGDFSLFTLPFNDPWLSVGSSVAYLAGTIDPPAACGNTYRFLRAQQLQPATNISFATPVYYGGTIAQLFTWYGGNMFISFALRTRDGATVSAYLIDPLGQLTVLDSSVANTSETWKIYSSEIIDAMFGKYTIAINMDQPLELFGNALVDCVAVTEAGHVQIYDFNSSPLTPPPWFSDPTIERIAYSNLLTVAQQEDINNVTALMTGINLLFLLPMNPNLDPPSATMSDDGGWTVIKLPPSELLPSGGTGWIRPAGLLPAPSGGSITSIGPYGFIDGAGTTQSNVAGQVASSFWLEVQSPGTINGSTVPGQLGSSATHSIVPPTNALGLSYAVNLPTATSLGEAVSYANDMAAVLDVSNSNLIFQSDSNYWGQIEVAPMQEVGWYAVTQPLTLPTGNYRLVFQNNSGNEMLLSRICLAPWASVQTDCPVVAPPGTITMPTINQTLQAAMTKQAATVRAILTATAVPYQATATARAAATQTALVAGGNATSQARATQTQAAALTATPRFAATSTAFAQGFRNTQTAIAAATQTRVYGSYTTATAQAIARATQTAAAIAVANAQATSWAQATARAALTQQVIAQATAVPRVTSQSQAQATANVYGTAYAATNAAAATAVATYANATTIPQATQSALVLAQADAIINAQATALASAIAELTNIPNAQGTQQAQSTAIAGTQIALQPTQIAQGTQQALTMPPEQPEPISNADCSRPDNPFNLAWWGEYLTCYALRWFSWSPANTAQVNAWTDTASQYEPYGTLNDTITALGLVVDLVQLVDWNTGVACQQQAPDASILMQQATGILSGNFSFVQGEVYDDTLQLPISPVVGPAISQGVSFTVDFLCKTGLMQWFQWFVNIAMIALIFFYIQARWIGKATEG